MAVRKRHELLGQHEHAHAHGVEDGLLVHVDGFRVDPVDEVLDQLDKGVVDRGHFFLGFEGVILK